MEHFQAAFEFVKAKSGGFVPEIAIVLGSGLGFFADHIENKIEIPYTSIPNFPHSTVVGHKGQFVLGTLFGKKLICMQGRVHHYEGHSLQEVVVPIRLMSRLGAKTLIVTNAAGGINTSFKPGTLMVIDDHINFMGSNPLIGPNDDSFGPRFPDMSTIYSERLRKAAYSLKGQVDAEIEQGVYLAVTGPSYETPAEIRTFRTLGADAVGMSTVPETIVARHAGMEVVGISCITNMAAGLQANLNHEEVTATANRVSASFVQVVNHLIQFI